MSKKRNTKTYMVKFNPENEKEEKEFQEYMDARLYSWEKLMTIRSSDFQLKHYRENIDWEVEVKLDNGSTIKLDKRNFSKCPNCGKKSVRAKEMCEGGGVKCVDDKCDYWYCD